MIRRSFDVKLFNEFANHPEVHPWLGAEGPIDLTEILDNSFNFALLADGGGFVLTHLQAGIYEVHSVFPPEARRGSVRAMRDGFDYMFTRTDCEKIVTQLPDSNPAAAALGKLARFRPMFRREDTPRGPTAFVGLHIDDWAQDTASLEQDGKAFHNLIEGAKARAGSELPIHPHDPAHERAAGATVRMVKAGNTVKGVTFYNRWAKFAGYAPISVISEQPPTVDVVDAVVEWRDSEMEIVLCR